ncbi:hypothetical protein GQ54DRAFT_79440 [Martensiomyces pterosporus]|nr:hypothetical protein GQ54DRAFT_79435 [Martensiomyces pterosporus]KAI8324193.1 hypothetical protein GQ54DRAFT_79440 [Martensiomyces pterosporus]
MRCCTCDSALCVIGFRFSRYTYTRMYPPPRDQPSVHPFPPAGSIVQFPIHSLHLTPVFLLHVHQNAQVHHT